MRLFLYLAVIIACQTAHATNPDYILEFREARRIEKTDPEGYLEEMLRCFHHAAAAGNQEYTSVGGLNACGAIYKQGKAVATAKLAREVLAALAPLQDCNPEMTTLRNLQFFNFIDHGLFAEGKPGAAWQANRAAAETLRGKRVAIGADGPSITLADLDPLRPELLSSGFRLIEREANLLDIAGRSVEARKLLDDTAAYLGKDWPGRLDPNYRFYASKVLASRAELIDFLGYEYEAIQAQQELVKALEGNNEFRISHLTLRMNLLRNLSQWNGPSQQILDEARIIAAELNTHGIDNNVNGLLAKMEFDLRESREPLEMLRLSALKRRSLGDAYEAFHSDRDNLALRVKLGDSDLDGDFNALLKTLRAHGDKSGEPTLYRMYGDYLLKQGRPSEAIPMYTECLRMTHGFSWFLHEPSILGVLIDARLATADREGARATLAALDIWLANHPDAPSSRRAGAEGIRGATLAKLGDEAPSRESFRLAREIGRGLPTYKQRDFTKETEDLAIKEMPKTPATEEVGVVPELHLQPLEVVGIAPPGGTALTRFSIFNPTARRIHGHFLLTGPGAALAGSGKASFRAGQPSDSISASETVAAGSESQIEISLAAGAGVDRTAVEVAWENDGQAAGSAARWQVSWDLAASRSIVVDASLLETNPFRSVPLFHELAVPLGDGTIGFRLHSPVPLRFEYLDASSHQLVAIDANGNGDFNDAGDLYLRGPGGLAAAIFPVAAGARSLTAEVRIFSPDGLPLLATGGPLVLEAEVYRNGRWTKEAEDTLK